MTSDVCWSVVDELTCRLKVTRQVGKLCATFLDSMFLLLFPLDFQCCFHTKTDVLRVLSGRQPACWCKLMNVSHVSDVSISVAWDSGSYISTQVRTQRQKDESFPGYERRILETRSVEMGCNPAEQPCLARCR